MPSGVSGGNWLIFIDGDCVLHHRFIEMHFITEEQKFWPENGQTGRKITNFILNDSEAKN